MNSELLVKYVLLDAKVCCEIITDEECLEAGEARSKLLKEIGPPKSLSDARQTATLLAYLLAKEEFPYHAINIATDLALGLADLTAETR